jgi:hypothetical protein
MRLKTFLALAILAPLGIAATFGLRIEPDENNICSERLAGAWVPDSELCERLGVKTRAKRIEFVVDDSFLDAIPAKFDKYLKDKQLFEAGHATWHYESGPKSFPYLLTTHSGNPILFTFRERDGEPLGDAEAGFLMVIPAKTHDQDLLFVGGDHDNEAFRPFRRVVEEKQ